MMWLLLLALPLQGFAAATMVNCGPNHHRMWEASAAAQVPSHGHAGHGDPHHAMGTAEVEHTTASSAPASEGSSAAHDLGTLSKFKCSACAACCMGAALPTATLTFASVAPATVPTFFVPVSHVGFFTDGPDRPPRLFLV